MTAQPRAAQNSEFCCVHQPHRPHARGAAWPPSLLPDPGVDGACRQRWNTYDVAPWNLYDMLWKVGHWANGTGRELIIFVSPRHAPADPLDHADDRTVGKPPFGPRFSDLPRRRSSHRDEVQAQRIGAGAAKVPG